MKEEKIVPTQRNKIGAEKLGFFCFGGEEGGVVKR